MVLTEIDPPFIIETTSVPEVKLRFMSDAKAVE
jgi:hypothetical protein